VTQYAIGIDLGGTNFRLALYRDLASLEPGHKPEAIAMTKEDVGDDRAPVAVVERLRTAVQSLMGEHDATDAVIGIGFAGMMADTSGHVANSPHFGWLDVPFGAMMREALGNRVVIDNDVNAITHGEARLGAAAGASNVLAVLAGTGIGGGCIADGQLIRGNSGCASEIGHTKVVISDDARPCHCGKRGCVEAYAGGRNLRDRIREELSGTLSSRATVLAGGPEAVEISHIDAAAAEGDPYAETLYREIAPLLGLALANAVTLLNPGHLVLGGGVLSRTPVLKEAAIAAMVVAANQPALDGLEIVDAALGDEAGLIGSALLALDEG
jgi:glucokinase